MPKKLYTWIGMQDCELFNAMRIASKTTLLPTGLILCIIKVVRCAGLRRTNMLLHLIRGEASFQFFLMWIGAIIVALTFHEFCHGFAAYRLGDRTAKRDGRLSFNPLRHIDPIGLLLIVSAGFGWAKPVMVNPYNLRNPKQDMAIISISGPLSNFVLGFVAAFAAAAIYSFGRQGSMLHSYAPSFLTLLFHINIGLGLFNMLPIPPLDGSKFFGFFLPDHLYFRFMNFRYGFILMVVLIASGVTSVILLPLINAVDSAYGVIISAILSLFA